MKFGIINLASGSKGNATLIKTNTTKILLDAGLSCRMTEQSMHSIGERLEDIDAILVTHCHTDHIAGIPQIVKKYNKPVYTYYQNYTYLARHIGSGKSIIELNGNDFFVGDITVSPFELLHDVHCFGYSFYHQGKKITVMTDLGKVTPAVIENAIDSNIIMIESNHDIEKLKENHNYSERLKQRILSDKGHLSNETCANALTAAINKGGVKVLLAHLSMENNTPELAYTITAKTLENQNIKVGKDIVIKVASQFRASEYIEAI